jgi:hypothetical protein
MGAQSIANLFPDLFRHSVWELRLYLISASETGSAVSGSFETADASCNVRYLGYFGEHILTLSFTARDPEETFDGTLIDHHVGNFEDARWIVQAECLAFSLAARRTGALGEGERRGDARHLATVAARSAAPG